MTDNIAIKVQNLTKTYRLYNSPIDRLKESLHPFRRKYHHDFYALKDVNFEIKKGETVGIIGRNGSGKSTLLKIITGVLIPTSGSVMVNGKIAALLELGAGFNPELTGVENVYFSGTLMGYTRDEMDEKLDDILAFADIGEFVHQPVKTYSSGMFVRLAFAVNTCIDPEIMIVDEALSVGDAYFQHKSTKKMISFKEAGGNIIFVSHDMNAVKTLCDSAILINNGKICDVGSASEIADLYMGMILKDAHQGEKNVVISRELSEQNKRLRVGTNELSLVAIKIYNEAGENVSSVVSESYITIEFTIMSHTYLEEPYYGIHIVNRYGFSVFETNNYCMGVESEPLDENQRLIIRFKMECNLSPGDYSISFGCANKGYGRDSFEETITLEHGLIMLKVLENSNSIRYSGCTNLRPVVEFIHES